MAIPKNSKKTRIIFIANLATTGSVIMRDELKYFLKVLKIL